MSGHSSVAERRTPERKVSGSSPDRIGGRIFFAASTVSTNAYFGIQYTLVFPQWCVKDIGHSVRRAVGRLKVITLAPYICGCMGA